MTLLEARQKASEARETESMRAEAVRETDRAPSAPAADAAMQLERDDEARKRAEWENLFHEAQRKKGPK